MDATTHDRTDPDRTDPDRTDIDTALYHAMNAPEGDRFRTLRARRAAVLLVLAMLATFVAAAAADLQWLVLVSMLAMVPLVAALNLGTRGLFEVRVDRLDERQVADRERAYRHAHPIAGVVISLVAAAAALNLLTPEPLAWSLLLGAVALHWMLPRLVAAWTLPEEPVAADEPSAQASWPVLLRAMSCSSWGRTVDWRAPRSRGWALKMLGIGVLAALVGLAVANVTS